MTDDTQLLRRFAETHDGEAFAELVRRHLGWVFATALRRLAGDAHLAEDAAQIVFTDLARKARTVGDGRPLAGWLHTSTVFTAAKLVRTEQRRRRREVEAETMSQINKPDASAAIDWDRVRPVLDDALGELKSTDRDAILMRYFQARNFSDIGAVLSVSENGARMRVDRAIDRLRERLARRGISSSAAALATVLAAEAGMTPPAALTATIVHTAVAAGAAAATAGAGSFLTTIAMSKIQTAITALVLVSGTTTIAVQQHQQAGLEAELALVRERSSAATVLSAENERLARLASEARTVELSRAEVERLRAQVAAARAAQEKSQVVTGHRSAGAISTARTGIPTRNGVFDIKTLDQTPQPQERPAPLYPFELKHDGVPGVVALDFVIDETGKVTDIEPLDSTHPAFTAAAIEAVSQWTFTPGMKDGQAVRTQVRLPIRFSLNDPAWF